jgi:hypothetical protein
MKVLHIDDIKRLSLDKLLKIIPKIIHYDNKRYILVIKYNHNKDCILNYVFEPVRYTGETPDKDYYFSSGVYADNIKDGILKTIHDLLYYNSKTTGLYSKIYDGDKDKYYFELTKNENGEIEIITMEATNIDFLPERELRY